MKFIRVLPVLLLASVFVQAQNWHVGVFGGVSAYNGDIVDKFLPAHSQSGAAIGVDLTYELNEHINIRGGFTYGSVSGYDRYSDKPELVKRNLSFQTNINEFSFVGEYNFFSLYQSKFTPYVYAGVAVFTYDPIAFDKAGVKTHLKPLSTEGQGIVGYNNKSYSLTQPAIPLGVGIKFAATDNIRIALEAGYRKLFTDYLDDVSKSYVDQADLFAAKGQEAVDLAYRGNELPTGSPVYPSKGAQRGNAKNKDSYYFVGLHLIFRIGGGDGSGGANHGSKKGYGCPANMF
jgi:hypothetical protein